MILTNRPILYDDDLHSVSPKNSLHVRDYVWNWCSINIRNGYSNALCVKCRADTGHLKLWISYKHQVPEIEAHCGFGEPIENCLERIKATFMLLEG